MKLLKLIFLWLKYLSLFWIKKKGTNRKIFIDIKNNCFGRYIYSLIQFFHISGYQVKVKPNSTFLLSTYDEYYSRKILDEKLVSFTVKSEGIVITDRKRNSNKFISPDYYSSSNSDSTYHVPISMHPNIYKIHLWNTFLKFKNKRNNSIIFAGNLNSSFYNNPSNENNFCVLNRFNLISSLKASSNCSILPPDEAIIFNKDHKIILVDNQKEYLEFNDYFNVLSKFDFFLALPGYIKPTCHNLVESLFSGTIPIIQKEYAALLSPPLIHMKNAIIFDSIGDIEEKIKLAFSLSSDTISELRRNVLHYYEENMSPKSVVNNILNDRVKNIFLEAEEYSVALLNNISIENQED